MAIQKTLGNLWKDGLKEFQFHVHIYTKAKQEAIPRSKLEGKDTRDTTMLLIDNYGAKEALQVTLDVLREIHQNQLACELETTLGKTTNVIVPHNSHRTLSNANMK